MRDHAGWQGYKVMVAQVLRYTLDYACSMSESQHNRALQLSSNDSRQLASSMTESASRQPACTASARRLSCSWDVICVQASFSEAAGIAWCLCNLLTTQTAKLMAC